MASDYESISRYNEKKLGEDRATRMSQVAMYADTTHFVFELLQNADDACATEIHFTVRTNELVVEHNGTPFTEEDVRAISYFGKGNTDITKIGHFGLGFKSVFAYTSSPKVHSGNESFEITQLYTVAATRHPDDLKPGRTRFVLPFDHLAKNPDYIHHRNWKSAEKACEEIACKLASLGAETLLFTKSLMEIHWATDEEEGHYRREDTPVDKSGREVYIVTGESEKWCYLVFNHPVFWHDENGNQVEHRPVEIAFGLDKRMAEGGSIQETEDARLFVFFPTNMETHVGFILQGPYRTTPARDNVSGDDDFNQHLVKETAVLLKDSLPNLKRLGLLNLDTLDTLPINHDRFKEGTFFYPLYASMRDVLANQPLLPTATRGFVGGSQAKLARGANLTKVFGPAQLEHLFGSTGLKWLDPDLTQDNYPDLHRFLVGKKSQPVRYFEKAEWIVPPIAEDIEVNAEQIAKRITAVFLSQQTDPWMIRFYEYLSGAEHSHFTSRPIIRLEGDKHVVPLGKNDVPNAYLPAGDEGEEIVSGLPTVKRSLVQRDEIREFLKDCLGLTQPDMADHVLKRILPRYAKPQPDITITTWQRHFPQILEALRTDPYGKREMLKTALKDSYFLLTESIGSDGKPVFVRAEEAYLNTGDNKLFFSLLSRQISFLAEGYYEDSVIDTLVELGVARSARVTMAPRDHQGYVSICHTHGRNQRGVDGFDPNWDIDGLRYEVQTLHSPERSKLFWDCLLPHSQCIRGTVETSSRKTFDNPRSKNLVSDLGKILMETAWLPDKHGVFHAPSELGLDDLPDEFEKNTARAKDLASKLRLRKSEEQQALAVLAKGNPRKERIAEYLLNADDDALDKFDKLIPNEKKPSEFKTFKQGISAVHRAQNEAAVDAPLADGTVSNPGRYQAKLDQATKASVSDAKIYPQTLRFDLVRNNSANVEAREFFYQQYQGECQVTGRTFAKADGKNYFVAVTLVSRLDAEHLNQPGNMLCLSADTSAKFLHASFEWLDDLETKMEQFKAEKDGGSEQDRKVRVRLAGHVETITWSEQHFMRLVSLWNNA